MLHSGSAPASALTRPVDYPVTVSQSPLVARIRFIVRDNGTGRLAADNVFLVDRKELHDDATGLKPVKAGSH